VAHIRHEYGLDRPIMPVRDLPPACRDRRPRNFLPQSNAGDRTARGALRVHPFNWRSSAFIVARSWGHDRRLCCDPPRIRPDNTEACWGPLAGISTPCFWLGLIGILVFSVAATHSAAGGSGSLVHSSCPRLVLGAGSAAMMAR